MFISRQRGRVQRSDFNPNGLPITIIAPSPFENKRGELRRPTPVERCDLEKMYGVPIIIDGFDYSLKPRHIPGLVVHLVENRQGLRDYRGDVNLFDGRTKLYKELLDNKWREYELMQKIDPKVMPRTILASELVRPSKAFAQSRQRLLRSLDLESVQKHLELFFSLVKKEFPRGAFIKYIREYGTCEQGQLTHTPEADAQKMAEIFMREIGKRSVSKKRIKESKVAAVRIVGFLILDPSEIIAQKKLHIAKTRDGTLAEVRVDFGSTGPIIANVRWGYDVEMDYNQRAFDFFQKFWQRWPAELKRLFGGADVVFCKDGSMKIIELNFGSESGFMDATQLIVPGNLFMSKILGRPTPLIARLEKLVMMPPREQVKELNKLIPRTKRDDETHYSLRDLHLGDVWLYLRDRLIENWMKSPSRAGARRLSTQLRYLAESQQHRIKDAKTQQLILDMARFGTEAMLEFLSKRRIPKPCPTPTPSEQLTLF